MNKRIIAFSLLLLTVFLTGCSNQVSSQPPTSQETKQPVSSQVAKVDKIEIFYFHGASRCYSCQLIERYAKETVGAYFQPELRDGIITFQSINGELPKNQALVIKYQARGSSLFVNAIKKGQDNIEEEVQVWRLVSDEQKFKDFFKNKLDNLLQYNDRT